MPGVDYVEETRARFWGKRDTYVWYFGVFGVLGPLSSLIVYSRRLDDLQTAFLTLSIVVAIAYLMLSHRARAGLVAVLALGLLVTLGRLAVEQRTAHTTSAAAWLSATTVRGVVARPLGLLFSILAYRSPRNKLAFKLAIDERELQRVYSTFVSNSLALRAAWFSVLGFVPFASFATLWMGATALARVDPSSWPPRGGRVPAIIAIVVSILWLLGWLGAFVFRRSLFGIH